MEMFLESHKQSHNLKEQFLQSLKSPGKLKYKRYARSPLRYAGGKSLAVGIIIEKIPEDITEVVSPFFGGGSVEIALANELDLNVFGYDIFNMLTNYWDIQLRYPEALYKRLLKLKPTRKNFLTVKNKIKKCWNGEMKLGKHDLATLYYFNHNTSYGPHFLGWPSDIYLDNIRYQKTIDRVRNFRAKNLKVRCASFETVIPSFNKSYLYCDPPYYLDGDSKTFVGMYPHRNFPIHHKGFDHEKLRDLLLAHKGGFVLCYNDCSQIRKWYKGLNMDTPSWQYTFGQGDIRIGENRSILNKGSHIKKSHELLIWKDPS